MNNKDQIDITINLELSEQGKRLLDALRPKGEWELASDDDGEYGFCSICGNDTDFSHYGKPYRFCPNCGADMRGNYERKTKR